MPPTPQTLHRRLLDWYATHRRDLPWRHTSDPYAILVAEVMLQQTQVERVVHKYTPFLRRFPTWQALAEASPGEVIRAWEGLGYNRRAVRLQGTARQVVGPHGGRLPQDIAYLLKLEGVGSYTAAAVACFAFGAQVPVLDTNVRRVLTRLLFGLGPASQADLHNAAQSLVDTLPTGEASSWNQALMDLGANMCSQRRPRCSICPLREDCTAAPLLQQPEEKRLAETPSPYRVLQTPFLNSSRYYRGRIIQRLRDLPEGRSIDLSTLGAALRSNFTPDALPWLHGLLVQLHREGLIDAQGLEHDSDGQDQAGVTVRLPQE